MWGGAGWWQGGGDWEFTEGQAQGEELGERRILVHLRPPLCRHLEGGEAWAQAAEGGTAGL